MYIAYMFFSIIYIYRFGKKTGQSILCTSRKQLPQVNAGSKGPGPWQDGWVSGKRRIFGQLKREGVLGDLSLVISGTG